MATNIGVGLSLNRNTRVAAREAVEQALARAGITAPDFVILYTTVGHDPAELLPLVREATGRAPLIGCSVEGCITADVVDESNYAVEVAVIASDELRLHAAGVADMASDPHAAGRTLGETLQPHCDDEAALLFVFADAFSLNYTTLKAGLDAGLGRALPAVGGGASNDIQSTRTFQFHDDAIHEHGVVCALLSSPAGIASVVTHGCRSLGVQQTVTRSRDNWILELDGEPVLDLLSTYITTGEQQSWLHTVNNLCLGLETPEAIAPDYDELCIRYLMGRDEDAGAVQIQTQVAEGTKIWLARREPERVSAAAVEAAQSLRAQLGDRRPKLMLQIECVGRGKLLLSEPIKRDMMRRVHAAAPDTPWLGAYLSGEIGPVGTSDSFHDMFHNYTAVLLAVL